MLAYREAYPGWSTRQCVDAAVSEGNRLLKWVIGYWQEQNSDKAWSDASFRGRIGMHERQRTRIKTQVSQLQYEPFVREVLADRRERSLEEVAERIALLEKPDAEYVGYAIPFFTDKALTQFAGTKVGQTTDLGNRRNAIDYEMRRKYGLFAAEAFAYVTPIGKVKEKAREIELDALARMTKRHGPPTVGVEGWRGAPINDGVISMAGAACHAGFDGEDVKK